MAVKTFARMIGFRGRSHLQKVRYTTHDRCNNSQLGSKKFQP